jgi:hypothetical protein
MSFSQDRISARPSIAPAENHPSGYRFQYDMSIQYEYGRPINEAEFIDLLKRSTMAERRPIDDARRIKAMLLHATNELK